MCGAGWAHENYFDLEELNNADIPSRKTRSFVSSKRGFLYYLHELIIPSFPPTLSTYMNQSTQIKATVEKHIFKQ